MRWIAGVWVLASCGAWGSSVGANMATALKQPIARAIVLEVRANQTVKKLAQVAEQGNAASSDEAVQQMKQIVDELAAIREELKQLKTTNAKTQSSVTNLERFQPVGYIQYQYRDSDEQSREQKSFALRRVRLGANYLIDKKTSFRATMEFGSGTNNLQSQLWEAVGIYTDGRYRFQAGQFVFPLGFDIPRSSADADFPERAIYNRRLFEGENGRGVSARYIHPHGFSSQIGLWDALSISDPEQIALKAGTHGRLAGTGAIRYGANGLDAGVSVYFGSRPTFEGTSATLPDANRQFVYLDATWNPNQAKNLTLRGEAMWGQDRPPGASEGRPLSGWQALGVYRLSPKTDIGFRYENFDPNLLKSAAASSVTAWTGAFSYWVNSKTKLTLGYEAIHDPARSPKRYSILTARILIRF